VGRAVLAGLAEDAARLPQEVEVYGVDDDARVRRLRADDGEVGFGVVPEGEEDDVEVAGGDQLHGVDEARLAARPGVVADVGGDAHLLERLRVADARQAVLRHEADGPPVVFEELQQVEDAPRPALAVELRDEGGAD
jgi:hypothetical protein